MTTETAAFHQRYRRPEHRLAEHAGRSFRIPGDCSITGVLDLDEYHTLVVMRRRIPHPCRTSLWARAVTIRVFRLAGGLV